MNDIEKDAAEKRKAMGECFKCRHHKDIARQCRVTGKLCKYPMEGCEHKDYPWGE